MSHKFSKGAKVKWKWGAHQAQGEIVQSFERRVSRTIKGEKIVREADADEPAYLIRQADGDRVLKSHSELSAG